MIEPKQGAGLGWDVLLGISLVGILAASWFALAEPKPAAAPPITASKSVSDIDKETQDVEERAGKAQQQIIDRTWNLDPEIFGSQILTWLTQASDEHHVELSGFRVRKTIAAANLLEAPVAVVAEGTFADVMALVGDIEQPDSKIAISQLNITSASGADKVTATLALTGFLYKEDK